MSNPDPVDPAKEPSQGGFYPGSPPPPPPGSSPPGSSPAGAAQGAPNSTGFATDESLGERLKPAVEAAKVTAQRTAAAAKETARRAWPIIEPIIHQGWINLRVWVPALANPDFRDRQVVYPAREFRERNVWTIELPQQCCVSDQTAGVEATTLRESLRCFELPMQIIAGSLAGFGFFGLLWLWLGGFKLFCLSLLSLAVGAAGLWLKSWAEQINLVIWSKAEHKSAVQFPEAVIFDDALHLMLPSSTLANAARMQIAQQRREQNKYGVASPADEAPSPSASATSRTPPPPVQPYKRDELPPIKLDD